jgi:hypothetical protein
LTSVVTAPPPACAPSTLTIAQTGARRSLAMRESSQSTALSAGTAESPLSMALVAVVCASGAPASKGTALPGALSAC